MYLHTRHNLGQFILDCFARLHGAKWVSNRKLGVDLARGRFANVEFFLLRPLTYMNESGYPVSRACNYLKIPHGNVVAVYDEINLPLGRHKITKRVGSGGHRGMANLCSFLSSCTRFRVGIGPKLDSQMDLKDYVLGKFTDEEQAALLYAMPEILEALRQLFTGPQTPLDNGAAGPIALAVS
jgi:PTH1 family peptidyl-tRNA hydrolase